MTFFILGPFVCIFCSFRWMLRLVCIAVALLACVAAQTITIGSVQTELEQCATTSYPTPCQQFPLPSYFFTPPTSCYAATSPAGDVLVFDHQRGLSFHVPTAAGIPAAPALLASKHCSMNIIHGQVGEWLYFSPNTDSAITGECNCDSTNTSNCHARALRIAYPDNSTELFDVQGLSGTPSFYSATEDVTLQIVQLSPAAACWGTPLNTPNLNGAMAFIERGTCVAGKSSYAQAAGAGAVLLWNPTGASAGYVFVVNSTIPGAIIGTQGSKIFSALNVSGAVVYASFGPSFVMPAPTAGDLKSGLQRINVTAAAVGISQIEVVRSNTTGAQRASFMETSLGGTRPYLWLFGENGLDGVKVLDLSSSTATPLTTFTSFSATNYGPLNYADLCAGYLNPDSNATGIVSDLRWTRTSIFGDMSDEVPTVQSFQDRHYLYIRSQTAVYAPYCDLVTAVYIWNITDVTQPKKLFTNFGIGYQGGSVWTARNMIALTYDGDTGAGQGVLVYPRFAAEPGLPNVAAAYSLNITSWTPATVMLGMWARVDKNGRIWLGIGKVGIAVLQENANGIVSQLAFLPDPDPQPAVLHGWRWPSCASRTATNFDMYASYSNPDSVVGPGGEILSIEWRGLKLSGVSTTTTSSGVTSTGATTTTGTSSGSSTTALSKSSTTSTTKSGTTTSTTGGVSGNSTSTSGRSSSGSALCAVFAAVAVAALVVL